MPEITKLVENIETLRGSLNKLIEIKKGNLQDPSILAASYIMNNAITEYNRSLLHKDR